MDSHSVADEERLRNAFRSLALQMQQQFQEAVQAIKHPSELGAAREKLLSDYLKRFLPDRYGIGTGFVVDAKGGVSRQIDVIVYDRVISPVFELPGGIRYFPCECVTAVGEVKSAITDRRTLHDALDKLRSVQQLDRYSGGSNTEVAIHGAHGHCKVEMASDGTPGIAYRTLGFIFTSRSMSQDTMIDELKAYCNANPRQYWPNIVVDFESYLISYVRKGEDRETLAVFPDEAAALYTTKPEEKDTIVLLFACLLVNFLTVARIVRPLLLEYFRVGSSRVDTFEF